VERIVYIAVSILERAASYTQGWKHAVYLMNPVRMDRMNNFFSLKKLTYLRRCV
jgi:hypothetical protein